MNLESSFIEKGQELDLEKKDERRQELDLERRQEKK